VVDHGVLKTLLTDRTPVTGVDHSTGNRFGFGARPINVIVTADSTLSDADMRSKLLTLASAQGHPYGVIVRQLSGGNGATQGDDPQEIIGAMMGQQRAANGPVARGTRVVKVFADGHEEPMRGAEIFGLTAASFKEIAAASRTRVVQDVAFSGGNVMFGGGGGGPVLYQMPSLLFANVTIRKPRGTTPNLPVVAPPQ
jgi:hypothetical protein